MAMVPVQQPTNLSDMFGAASMMPADIATQQANQQLAGNQINQQQGLQDLYAQQQKLPQELQGEQARNQLMGAQANEAQSLATANNNKNSIFSQPDEKEARLRQIAANVSDSDLQARSNQIQQDMLNPDPNVSGPAQQQFSRLKDVQLMRMRMQYEAQMAAIAPTINGANQRAVTQMNIDAGKYKKNSTDLTTRIALENDPVKKAGLVSQALAEAQSANDSDGVQHWSTVANAIKPVADAQLAARTAGLAGKVNASEVSGLPAVTQPTVPGGKTPQQSPDDIKADFKAGKITRDEAIKRLKEQHSEKFN